MEARRSAAIELASLLRPDDRVLVACGAGEPAALTNMLVEQRLTLPPIDVLLGFTLMPTIRPGHLAPLHVTVLGGFGANAPLIDAGADVLAVHMSALPDLIAQRSLRVDVLMLQCGPADGRGMHNLGVTADVVLEAARTARVVLAEVNDQMPRTFGDTELPAGLITHQLRTSRGLPELQTAEPKDTDLAIAARVAELVPDRSVLQVGIGRVPEAVAVGLCGHRDLGLHSGYLGDWALDLIEAGAVTNAFKPLDRGVTVGGVLMGSQRLYAWAHENPALSMRSARYTHGADVLAQLDTLVTINSAIEIDLTGQVNAEVAGERYLGAVGGGVDYIRAGTLSRAGRSIIVLPSTASNGTRSRIVDRIGPAVVTTPRTDVDVVVTEHGVAQLRGQSLAERARRLVAVAAGEFRDELERSVQ
jgi:acyl-CoA hydrolase